MSEKLDGVRAYWNGKNLISRSGKIFNPPKFFTKEFPTSKLDGELWSRRGEFSKIASIVNQKEPHNGWKKLTYNIFEVPNAKGDLLQRLAVVKESQYLKLIKQIKVKNRKELKIFLKSVEKRGGEGVVVRDGSLGYYVGRNSNALKVKSYQDSECKVIAHKRGKGKYSEMLGSFVCEMSDKKHIKIGSGLTNLQRKNFFPEIGAIITFKYYGLTSKGNPRFPIFLHKREN